MLYSCTTENNNGAYQIKLLCESFIRDETKKNYSSFDAENLFS